MIRFIKRLLLNTLAGANIVSVLLMLLSGYSDRLSPVGHEELACAGMAFPIIIAVNLLFVPLWVIFSWRRLIIPVVGLVLAYVPIRIYIPLHADSTIPDDALRVISWNVAGYGGNWKYEHAFDSVWTYIERQHADIVCLQEDMGARVNVKNYKLYFPYNDTTHIAHSPSLTNVLGLHTRFPILKKERINYDSHTNGSVAHYLLIDGDTVIVINNHLELTHLSVSDRARYNDMIEGEMEKEDAQAETIHLIRTLGSSMAKRAPQADAVHAYIEAHSHYPIILCGDFNDTPISYARHTIAQRLTDCYVETGRGVGISFNRKGFKFRIDHLMCSSHFKPFGCKIDSKNDVSDHYPLLCGLKMVHKP
jgi:endonuclease/exonuclease/phosphatase family metal-dependent hydrolase